MTVDANVHDLGPGDCIHVPAGVRHDGAVVGETAVARIVVFSPGGMERFFEELAGVGDDGTQALGLAIQHGWEFA